VRGNRHLANADVLQDGGLDFARLDAVSTDLDLAITPTDSVRVIQPAIVPTTAAFPNPARNAVLAFLIAFVLACGAVLLRHTFADRYVSAEEAAVDLGLPVMAELPRAAATDSKALEAIRSISCS